ncbi:hypothetical protein GQ53DRAFT_833852 [Thozetella sp. PMI_491]|nr:hypothetical protein GQ53DRAFT_833852 [Thozetella sp. PMI_491]
MIWMQSWPRNVRRRIFAVLGHAPDRAALPGLCSVSKEWQEALEHYTFAEIFLTTARLAAFDRIVVGQQRRWCVRSVVLHVELDPYDRYMRDERETEAERQRSAEVFTKVVDSFLNTMALWGAEDRSPHGLDFHLMVYSPSDVPKRSSRTSKPSLLTHRAQAASLKLDPAGSPLPSVDVITGFRCTGRHILPTSVLDIISRLRNLTALDARLNHDSGDGRDIQQRRKFAGGLQYHARSVTNCNLHRTPGLPGSSRSCPKAQGDKFYESLRRFSERFETFIFDDSLDAYRFFSPFLDDSPRHCYLPYWDKLETLSIRNSYLVKRPYMRVSNRAEALTCVFKLLAAVGRAAQFMPNLRKARICQYVLTDDQLEWFILTYKYHRGQASLDFKGLKPSRLTVDLWQASITATRNTPVKLGLSPSDQTVL